MKIKLVCKNCNWRTEITQEQSLIDGRIYLFCENCKERTMIVENLMEIIQEDLESKIKHNIDCWFKIFGIEYTIELIMRTTQLSVQRLYIEELKKRGLFNGK